MILKKFKGGSKYTEYNPVDGSASEFGEIEGAEICGFCEQTRWGLAAVYPAPEEETLIVQINGTTWDLFTSDTTVVYNHHYDDEMTYFKIADEENEYEVRYEAWWKDVPHFEPNKWAASREDENSHEDFFGYVLMLWQSEEKKDNLIESWSGNLPK
ncbi:hypothetical protein G3I44_19175 [Halogeometricum borinquense]|uniref:Uncharacterized protein n=1 Tax=Halogeometricum borinquense TaxID=60847 RepID=A0A6C0UNP6_9EURY|nr:hypothetical protein [Halogeometricum borinquense]QIB76203.1 hypothetical protein G3I44_19175 [Halogeometricum borinquense]